MKKILVAGLIVSLISVVTNVFVYSYFSNEITEKDQQIGLIKNRNLVLSIEFNHAENLSFYGDFYTLQLDATSFNDRQGQDSNNKQLLIKQYQNLIKAANMAYNSTIFDPQTDYDSLRKKELERQIEIFNKYVTEESDTLPDRELLSSRYWEYYKLHEDLIVSNNQELSELSKQSKDLKWYYELSKGATISLQIIGLILVFLKDYFE